MLVAADSDFLLLQKLRGTEAGLKDYISRNSLPARQEFAATPALVPLAEHLEKVAHTGAAELGVFSRVLKQNPAAASRIEVRHAREMSTRDFKQDNFLILGSARSNPWCALFEEHTLFRTQFDPQIGKVVIINRQPRPGEPKFWGNAGIEEFAHIAVVPNLTGSGKVLLATGTAMSAKEAGGDFLNDPDVPARLARALGVASLRQVPSFEVILRSRSLDGTPQGWDIVALRPKSRQ